MTKAEILVIDDEPSVGLLLQMAGQRQGWTLHLAGTGAEGLAWLDGHSVDLVLLDLGLPGLPGLEVLRRIKSSRPALPVLIMSGSRYDHAETLRLGAAGNLQKPFTPAEFYAAVRGVLGHAPPRSSAA